MTSPKTPLLLGCLIALLPGIALAQPATPPPPPAAAASSWDPQLGGGLRVKGRAIVDAQGRQVVLRGVNAGRKSGDFLPEHSRANVDALVAANGVNLVRLYVAWRAIAPQPGKIDAAYVERVRERAQRWSDAGVAVLIDMHQDVWGGPVTSHGAPEWASLGRGRLDLPPGSPWQLSYVEPRVWKSFEALWSNRVVPGTGRGLADHYADAWVALVKALSGVERLAGYDLINEPFLGNEVMHATIDLLKGAARPALVASGRALGASAKRGFASAFKEGLRRLARPNPFLLPVDPLAPFHTARAGAEGFKRGVKQDFERELMRMVRDPKQHHRLLAALGDVNARFERRLSAFYTRVGRRIRALDPRTPIFIEPMALVGIGVPCRLPRPALSGLVYAPHLYDAFVDSGLGFDGELTRLRTTFRAHRLAAARLRAPLVLGEWGHLDTLPEGADRDRYAQGAAATLESGPGVGAAYWEHRPGDEAEGALDLVLRPFPRRVMGRVLTGGGYAPATQTLTLRFRPAAGEAPTVIAAPRRLYPHGATLRASDAVRWRHLRERGLILIHARPSAGVLRVEIRPKAE